MESRAYTAIAFHSFSKDLSALTLVEEPFLSSEDSLIPVQIKFASIHPSDLGRIMGVYGSLPQLPAIGGREAVGHTLQDCTLPNGDFIPKGQTVLVLSPDGTWQSTAFVSPQHIFALPEEIPLPKACLCAGINGATAWALLEQYASAQTDVIIQNAANSALGLLINQLATRRNITCINLVRRSEVKTLMEEAGFSNVYLDNDESTAQIQSDFTSRKISLAINTVGGKSVERLCKLVSDHGNVVTLGGMSRDPIYFPTRHLIFRNIQLTGFWLDGWLQKLPRARQHSFWKHFHTQIASMPITLPDPYLFSLDEYEAAIQKTQQPRWGKVLFAL